MSGPRPDGGSNWIGGEPKNALPTLPEVEKLRGLKVLCLRGADERDPLCPKLPDGIATKEAMQGAHRFGGDHDAVARRILAAVELEER